MGIRLNKMLIVWMPRTVGVNWMAIWLFDSFWILRGRVWLFESRNEDDLCHWNWKWDLLNLSLLFLMILFLLLSDQWEKNLQYWWVFSSESWWFEQPMDRMHWLPVDYHRFHDFLWLYGFPPFLKWSFKDSVIYF